MMTTAYKDDCACRKPNLVGENGSKEELKQAKLELHGEALEAETIKCELSRSKDLHWGEHIFRARKKCPASLAISRNFSSIYHLKRDWCYATPCMD